MSVITPPGFLVVLNPYMSDGQVRVGLDAGTFNRQMVVHVGINEPHAIAKRIVREGLADVLAWLDDPPDMRTGEEILDSWREQGPMHYRPGPDGTVPPLRSGDSLTFTSHMTIGVVSA